MLIFVILGFECDVGRCCRLHLIILQFRFSTLNSCDITDMTFWISCWKVVYWLYSVILQFMFSVLYLMLKGGVDCSYSTLVTFLCGFPIWCLKVLLPLVNVPMIDYTLAWLESAGIEEVFVFCCAHSKQVINYLENSHWVSLPHFEVTTIESHNSVSAGDALRLIYERHVVCLVPF